MDDVKQRALDVLTATKGCKHATMPCADCSEARVRALSDAGLLLTPLHERALAEWKKVARLREKQHIHSEWGLDSGCAIGREALEAEKPKEGPWRVRKYQTQAFGVFNGEGATIPRGTWNTEAEAEAVAKALNELPR